MRRHGPSLVTNSIEVVHGQMDDFTITRVLCAIVSKREAHRNAPFQNKRHDLYVVLLRKTRNIRGEKEKSFAVFIIHNRGDCTAGRNQRLETFEVMAPSTRFSPSDPCDVLPHTVRSTVQAGFTSHTAPPSLGDASNDLNGCFPSRITDTRYLSFFTSFITVRESPTSPSPRLSPA